MSFRMILRTCPKTSDSHIANDSLYQQKIFTLDFCVILEIELGYFPSTALDSRINFYDCVVVDLSRFETHGR
jgi:hypothetical protein